MEKHITNERTGLNYELVGDYYLIAEEYDPKKKPIGIWEQWHLRHLKRPHKVIYANLLASCPNILQILTDRRWKCLNSLQNGWLWQRVYQAVESYQSVGRMNNMRNRAAEIVNNELILIYFV